MEESEVVEYLKSFLKKEGWQITWYVFQDYEADVAAMKADHLFIIEAKGETKGGHSHLIKVAIGQIVALMNKIGLETHYGIALPGNVAVFLSKFGLEGLRALNLHLFYVEDVGRFWPKGTIWHLDPENLLEFVRQLREQGEASLLTLSSPLPA